MLALYHATPAGLQRSDGPLEGALWIDLPHRPDVEVLSALWRPAT